ncbi:MAG TPA: protein-L-isoaspartate(D-aspartate) O-methyltransferase [Pirellulales bacterium]|nr:protein-L-isoaspartate(D-aspartate) O-methyltransferase [Pirellulales bacterium]
MDAAQLQFAKRSMLRHDLKRRGIRERRVLAALERVPRERFVPAELEEEAYADSALAIDCGQTISQPYIVALMTEALALSGNEKVLEIGTGSGYQTAVLAELAARVVSIERHAELSEQAERRLTALGYRNVERVVGDGTLGWPKEAPYDRVLVTAAAPSCPPALVEQLAEGGVLVIPVGAEGEQELQRWCKQSGALTRRRLTSCRFVPLIGEAAQPAGSQNR